MCSSDLLYSEKYGIPLHLSIVKNKYYITELILANKNVDANIVDMEGNNALHVLLSQFIENDPLVERIFNMLLEKNCNQNEINSSLMTPLHLAVKKNQKVAIKLALKSNKNLSTFKKFDTNIKCGKYNWKALHFAVIYSDLEIVKLLIDSGANVFACDLCGRRPRDIAILNSTISKILYQKEIQYRKIHFKKNDFNSNKILLSNLPVKLNFDFTSKINLSVGIRYCKK